MTQHELNALYEQRDWEEEDAWQQWCIQTESLGFKAVPYQRWESAGVSLMLPFLEEAGYTILYDPAYATGSGDGQLLMKKD